MNRKTKKDLRFIKTETLIRQTFRDMFNEMKFSQICITELAKRAKINRKTFYLHYDSLDDLLGECQIELYSAFFQKISDLFFPDDLDKLVREFFTFFSQVGETNEKILSSQGNFQAGKSPNDYFQNELFHYYDKRNQTFAHNDDIEINILNAYLNASLTSIYTQWTNSRKKSLEDIIAFATKIILNGITSVLSH